MAVGESAWTRSRLDAVHGQRRGRDRLARHGVLASGAHDREEVWPPCRDRARHDSSISPRARGLGQSATRVRGRAAPGNARTARPRAGFRIALPPPASAYRPRRGLHGRWDRTARSSGDMSSRATSAGPTGSNAARCGLATCVHLQQGPWRSEALGSGVVYAADVVRWPLPRRIHKPHAPCDPRLAKLGASSPAADPQPVAPSAPPAASPGGVCENLLR